MNKAIEVTDIWGIGFVPLVSVNDAQIALLSYLDELKIENIAYVEAHNMTDEIFMLLEGECFLIYADVEEDRITDFHIIALEKNKLYNVKRGVFHHHVLSINAKVLIYESKDTNYDNSSRIYFTEQEKEHLINVFTQVSKG